MGIELLTERIVWVLFAHFIGDIALQNTWMEQKGKIWYAMLCHCMVWTACICIALQFLGIFALWKVAFLFGGHWICDKWKSTKPKNNEGLKYLYIDQGIHFLQCLIVIIF